MSKKEEQEEKEEEEEQEDKEDTPVTARITSSIATAAAATIKRKS